MNVLKLDKSPYENGKISGSFFKNRVKLIIPDYNIYKEEIQKQADSIKEQFPSYWEETMGKADGLGVSPTDYFSIMCPEITTQNIDKCTTIISKNSDERFILIHNEDDEWVDGNFCISKYINKDGSWFFTNDMWNMPFGNGVSWNSHGIAKTINYCHNEEINTDGLPRYFSQRHISEAVSIDDLIKRCGEVKLSSGYHINAVDVINNAAVSIEINSDHVDVLYVEDIYVHTNHFIHGNFENNQIADNGSNSIFRLNKAKELLQKVESSNIKDIENILNYRGDDNIFETSILQTEKDPYRTLFRFVFDGRFIKIEPFVYNELLFMNYRGML